MFLLFIHDVLSNSFLLEILPYNVYYLNPPLLIFYLIANLQNSINNDALTDVNVEQQPSFNSKTSPFKTPLNLNLFLIILGVNSSTYQFYSIVCIPDLLLSSFPLLSIIDLLLDKQSLSKVLYAILD